jgi:hypothetical protein
MMLRMLSIFSYAYLLLPYTNITSYKAKYLHTINTLFISRGEMQKVDYNLRSFRLLPDSFNDTEKLVLEPFEDNPSIFIKLLSVILEKKVHSAVGVEESKLDQNIKQCIYAMGFQLFYVDKLYRPFEIAIAKGRDTNWTMLSVREWAHGYLENILMSLK